MSESGEMLWRRCSPGDATILGGFNAQLAEDEGAVLLGPPSVYVDRMRGWLAANRYEASMATLDGSAVGYALWREDPDYGDVFVRQFFIARERRGAGLGRRLFERAADELWRGKPLRLDVYDSNPRGGAFWESLGFAPYSRLMRRPPAA